MLGRGGNLREVEETRLGSGADHMALLDVQTEMVESWVKIQDHVTARVFVAE